MEHTPPAPLGVLRRTVALARLAFGPYMSVQAPPNLAPDGAASWPLLLSAGINDWGGKQNSAEFPRPSLTMRI